MNSKKQFWITIALINLCIVALLGVTLRSKILFSMHGIDFTNVLHAHAHFTFSGWITLALFSLLTYEILPEKLNSSRNYHYLFWGTWITSAAMLATFMYEGYAFLSILCSILFILVTYVFSYLFIRDVVISRIEPAVKILCVFAMVYLIASSVGPLILAWLMASQSVNHLLYKDSSYTYLHLQYNGFFSLSVFALFFNRLYKSFSLSQLAKLRRFVMIFVFSVMPTLFISYLWHFSNIGIRIVAIFGSICILATLISLFDILISIKPILKTVPRFIRTIGFLSFVAFLLKSLLQTGTIIPFLGKLVFGDRAIIVGYLHLVLLGFVSLYILTHLLYSGLLNASSWFTRIALLTFISGVMVNEAILMVQGFGNMLMISNGLYAWLLWGASLWLLTGTILIFTARLKIYRQI